MINESGPKSIEQEAREFVGRRGIPGDLSNNHTGQSDDLRHPRTWKEIVPLLTYEGYMREKFNWNPPVAEAVIAASDHKLVTDYNNLIQRINTEIGEGVSIQEQADKVAAIFGEIDHFMRNLNNLHS